MAISQVTMDLSLLLVGRDGNGKSSTGNSILGGKHFTPTSNCSSVGVEIQQASATVSGRKVTVTEVAGLEYPDADIEGDLEDTLRQIEKTITENKNGFNAVIFVLKFGVRFTKQEKDALLMIRSIFGSNVVKDFGVVVMTNGDCFDSDEGHDKQSFEEWRQGQTGEVRDLFEDCENRCVLFNNRTKDEGKMKEQRKLLFSMVTDIGRLYRLDEYEKADKSQTEIVIQSKLPKVEQHKNNVMSEVWEELGKIDPKYLVASCDFLKLSCLLNNMKEKLLDLNMWLKEEDKNTGVLKQLFYDISVAEMRIYTKRRIVEQKLQILASSATFVICCLDESEFDLQKLTETISLKECSIDKDGHICSKSFPGKDKDVSGYRIDLIEICKTSSNSQQVTETLDIHDTLSSSEKVNVLDPDSPPNDRGQVAEVQGHGSPPKDKGQVAEVQGHGSPPKDRGQVAKVQGHGSPPKDRGQVAEVQGHGSQPKDRGQVAKVQGHGSPPKDRGQVAEVQGHSSPPKDRGQVAEVQGSPPKDRGQVAKVQGHGSPPKDRGQVAEVQGHGSPPKDRRQVAEVQDHGSPPKDRGQVAKVQGHGSPPKDRGQVAEVQGHGSPPKDRGQVAKVQGHGSPPKDRGQVAEVQGHGSPPKDRGQVAEVQGHGSPPKDRGQVAEVQGHCSPPKDRGQVAEVQGHGSQPKDRGQVAEVQGHGSQPKDRELVAKVPGHAGHNKPNDDLEATKIMFETIHKHLKHDNLNHDVICLISKYEQTLTKEEIGVVIEKVKTTYGTNKIKIHSILILTCDNDNLEAEKAQMFEDWCQEETGANQQLLKACGNRCVLLNPWPKDEGTSRDRGLATPVADSDTGYACKNEEVALPNAQMATWSARSIPIIFTSLWQYFMEKK